jgi:hypothetical protein
MTDEQTPIPSSIPPIPPPPAEAAPPKRRATGLVVGALVVVVAVIAGLVAFNTLGDKERANAAPLALAFTAGQSETYTMHMTMDGTLNAGELLGEQPIVMDVTQVVTWEVVSVDDEGVATIEVTTTEMSGTMNGVALPAEVSSTPPVEMQIAPDGRILSAGGMSFSGLEQTGGASFPGMGQMTPLLPDGPVAPGDTWTKDFSQEIPFGEGTIGFTSTSTLERYEDVDGVNAAVITTEFTVPMDFTLDFGELLASFGDTSGVTGATGLAGFEDASIAYGGQGTFRQTSWIDPEAEKMLKTSSAGSFDMTMAFSGLDVFEGQTMSFAGDFTQELAIG